jgi:hypothetical protein
MDMWTAALKWAMNFDSIVCQHNVALAADAEQASFTNANVDTLNSRTPVAAPSTPRQFSLPRDSLTIPLDDDVRQCITLSNFTKDC